MKRSADQWGVRISDHVAFFSYRWLAWAIAALALTLPGRPTQLLPRDAGILLLVAVINVVATALAQGYVRVARQRPALLLLDLLAGVAVLWLSGGLALPFLPYALAGLVLPALLFGWRGAVTGAAAFVALDLVGLAVLSPVTGANLAGPAFVVRLLTPLAFAATWAALGRVLSRGSSGLGREARGAHTGADKSANSGHPAAGQTQSPRLPRPSRSETSAPGPANSLVSGPMVMTRAVSEGRGDLSRRLLYDLTLDQGAPVVAALEQIGAAIAGQGSLEVRVSCTGAPRPLTQAQQTLLLRAAHEALLNVQQHARARVALVTLTYEPAEVALLVQDDGVGLLDGTYERPGLHALRAIRYRLAELDGQLAVFESESGGVTVRATLPFE